MEATLLIPYNYSDPQHDFDSSEEIVHDGSQASNERWQKMKKEYEDEMLKTYRQYRPVINRNLHRLGSNMAINNEGAKERTNYRQQGTYMTETIVMVNDMENHPMNIDTLIEYYKSGEPFILDLQLPVYRQNEELEPEIKAWIRETYKINNAPDLLDEERLAGYTKRDLKIKFKDSQSSALLKDTKMVDIVNSGTFAFLVQQIIFFKS